MSSDAGNADRVGRLCKQRYLILTAAAVIFALYQLQQTNAEGGTWGFYRHSTPLEQKILPVGVYTGPLSIIFGFPFRALPYRPGWLIASAILMAFGLLSIRLIEQAAAVLAPAERRIRELSVVIGGLVLLYAWSYPAVQNGHPDDVIALTGVALAVRGVASQHWKIASGGIAVAIGGKPWALLVLPLAAACSGRRIRGLVLALGGWLAMVLPFLLTHHGSLRPGSANLSVSRVSGLHYLGVAVGTHPSWSRTVQLGIAWALGALAVAAGRWYLAPLVALSLHVNIDPELWPYYYAGPTLGLFVWDLVRPLRVAGLRTVLGVVVFLVLPSDLGGLHLTEATTDRLFGSLRLLLTLAPFGVLVAAGLRARRARESSR